MGGNTSDPSGLLKMNLDLFESTINTSSFIKTKAFWNRMEQNLRVQNALSNTYQKMGIDEIAIQHKLQVQLNNFYKKGRIAYPIRSTLRSIKKAIGF
jgi:hypothetical protein